MKTVEFKGFAGVTLVADVRGDANDPAVVCIHGAGQTRSTWSSVASALHMAGRQVITVDLRGHGDSEWPSDGRYEFDAFVDDLRAVLAQLPVRPVIIASDLGGRAAIAALGEGGGHLASGLILVDGYDAVPTPATDTDQNHYDSRLTYKGDAELTTDRLADAASHLALPTLSVGIQTAAIGDPPVAPTYLRQVSNLEVAVVEYGLAADNGEALNAIIIDFLERRCPLAPPEYREGSDARTFRDALGCFATGVTIVTAMNMADQPIGLTANSFTSVSLDPPLLLVCIAKTSGSAPVLHDVDRFAVNVLQIGQQLTSNRFAGKGEDRFAATPWHIGEFGTPVLTGSLASFECARDAVHDGGDHFILVGRVLKAMFEPRRDPLLYFRGKYRRLHFA